MAVCEYCGREMTSHVSCTVVEFDDQPEHPRVRYGDEDGWDAEDGLPCHDCGTPPGGLHHPGCDVERCAVCGGQAICCECPTEEDD